MPARCVLVHECKPSLDDGKKFVCTCTHKVSSQTAAGLVARGRARWKLQLVSGRGLVAVHSEVILVERHHRLHAPMISADHIESAYVQENKYAAKRVELFKSGNKGGCHGRTGNN